jgi:nucleoside diphosphate kinase
MGKTDKKTLNGIILKKFYESLDHLIDHHSDDTKDAEYYIHLEFLKDMIY